MSAPSGGDHSARQLSRRTRLWGRARYRSADPELEQHITANEQETVLHAEFWQRAVAYTIDWVVVFTLAQLLYVAIPIDLAMALNLLFPFAYFGWCNGELGRTLGKRLLGLHVVDQQSGARIGFGRALLRHLVFFLLFLALIVPGIVNVLFPLWDKRRQTLHDKAVRSVVVAVVRPYTDPA